MEELFYQIALTLIPKVGAVTAKNLISYCGGVQSIFEANKKALLKIPGVGPQIAQSILDKNVLHLAEKELKFVEQQQINPLFFLDQAYPHRLKHYHNCPILLYYKGNAPLNTKKIVSIVGTRRPSPYGVMNCEKLVEDLKEYSVLIVSGLAFGIDITAHKTCLQQGIATIGVLGHGLKRIYPPQHRAIAEKMTSMGGLLTEFPSDTLPDRERFPMRNRIIAGMCDALVVVETAQKGGSMITALIANDYNKDVFAFPGQVNQKNSRGCNYLIKRHRAALLESAQDLAELMRWVPKLSSNGIQTSLFTELSSKEKIVVDLLQEKPEINIDQLTVQSQMTNSEMVTLLLSLEFKGVVKSLPGKRYIVNFE